MAKTKHSDFKDPFSIIKLIIELMSNRQNFTICTINNEIYTITEEEFNCYPLADCHVCLSFNNTCITTNEIKSIEY